MINPIYEYILSTNSFAQKQTMILEKIVQPNLCYCYFAFLHAYYFQEEEYKTDLCKINVDSLSGNEKILLIESEEILAFYHQDYERVIQLSGGILENNPDSVLTYYLLAKIDLINKRSRDAIKKYHAALFIYPDFQEALYGLVSLYVTFGSPKNETVKLIKRMQPGLRKTFYDLIVRYGIGSINGVLIICFFIVLFFLPITHWPIFITTLSVTFILDGICIIRLRKEKFILMNILGYQIILLCLLLLSSLLK
jgi:tetratricopeptide (TPR) repeat protein